MNVVGQGYPYGDKLTATTRSNSLKWLGYGYKIIPNYPNDTSFPTQLTNSNNHLQAIIVFVMFVPKTLDDPNV